MITLLYYSEAISHPYSQAVRGPGTENINVLDLGPLHEKLARHLELLIDTPELILAPDAEPSKAIFNSDSHLEVKWHCPDAVAAAQKLAPSLPHVRGVFVAFLRRTLVTWRRFSAEFAADGVIASSSAAQKKAAYMCLQRTMQTKEHSDGVVSRRGCTRLRRCTSTTQGRCTRGTIHG